VTCLVTAYKDLVFPLFHYRSEATWWERWKRHAATRKEKDDDSLVNELLKKPNNAQGFFRGATFLLSLFIIVVASSLTGAGAASMKRGFGSVAVHPRASCYAAMEMSSFA
jgi:hypothetical protein